MAEIQDNIPKDAFFLGFDRDDHSPVTLAPKHLLRHMMAVGSSGSGKTVLCKVVVEECVRHGIPAICIDPQGDLCSLALAADDPAALADKGVDPALAQAFADKAEVVVFTPAARKGVPLCADPIQGDVNDLPAEERTFALSGMATVLTGLLGYRLDGNEGQGVSAVFEHALNELHAQGRPPHNLQAFTDWFTQLEDLAPYERLLKATALGQMRRRLARLDVGVRRLLFHEGLPLDIDLLLGRGDNAAVVPGKTRVAVVYLNTLTNQDDKTFFVAALADRLYRWMLKNPASRPQALFYIDEVAPFIPPIRKPASKPGLSLLFKQARKYGVSCLMATQNPGDVDYKAMAQFGTWAVGRLTTVQDVQKVEPTLKSLDPVNTEALQTALPRLQPGEFFLLSPDAFASAKPLQTRWLYTRHATLTEADIEVLANIRWGRFAELEAQPTPQVREEVSLSPSQRTKAGEKENPPPAPLPEDAGEIPADEIDAEILHYTEQLTRSCSMNTREFSTLTGLSESKARAMLKTLVAKNLAQSYREGRGIRYWATQSGLRPDLGLCHKVTALIPKISRGRAETIAHDHRERKLFGWLGDDETVGEITLEYHVCLRLRFRETAARGVLGKLLGSRASARRSRSLTQKLWDSVTDNLYEERADSVYLHPYTLHILTWHPSHGIRMEDRPEEQASDIEDFDSLATEARLPGELCFDESDWRERRNDEAIKKQFKIHYDATPQSIEPVFLPVWRLHLATPGESGTRIVTVDALSGQLLLW